MYDVHLAGQTGLEPATCGFGDRCATNCATTLYTFYLLLFTAPLPDPPPGDFMIQAQNIIVFSHREISLRNLGSTVEYNPSQLTVAAVLNRSSAGIRQKYCRPDPARTPLVLELELEPELELELELKHN